MEGSFTRRTLSGNEKVEPYVTEQSLPALEKGVWCGVISKLTFGESIVRVSTT